MLYNKVADSPMEHMIMNKIDIIDQRVDLLVPDGNNGVYIGV